MPANTVVFGEVGLSGEVRQVGQADVRLKEAAKLGFAKALIPRRKSSGKGASAAPLDIAEVDRLSDLVDRLGGDHGRGA